MNPYHEPHIVRIRHRITRSRHQNRAVYKYHRYELNIPAKYKDLAEAFMNKDLQVEATQENCALIILAKPTGRFSSPLGVRNKRAILFAFRISPKRQHQTRA